MKYIKTNMNEIGFVHEDSFEAFLKSYGVIHQKVVNKKYNFFEYKSSKGKRLLVCSKFVFNPPDEFFEETFLFELEEREHYNTDDVIEKIKSM